jgi:hypothetical protein
MPWNTKGIRTSLSRGPKSTVHEPSPDSVFKMGAAIPIFSRIFVGQRIRHRENAISKIGRTLDAMVTAEKGKIEKVITAAESSDIHNLVVRARNLREKLEDAACTKIKFSDRDDDEADVPSKPGRPAKAEPKNVICIKGIAGALFVNGSHGKVVGKGSAQTFKPNVAGLNTYVDDCVKNGGKTTLPDVIVSTFTGGAKTGDVSIDVSSEF